MTTHVRFLENPVPVNRVAARVIGESSLEDRFAVALTPVPTLAHSSNFLPVAPIPKNVPELRFLIGKRRGRLTLIGYAADQPKSVNEKPARWVVRCDCGNYEHRTRIKRWLSTSADDHCRECGVRERRIGKRRPDEVVMRGTVIAAKRRERS